MPRHYLNFADLSRDECEAVLRGADAVKAQVVRGERRGYLANRLLLMVFEKNSTRTRASFAAAMTQAGGAFGEFSAAQLQMGRNESVADTARALSSYADVLMLRVVAHSTLLGFAGHAACPIINGLSDVSHPCQVLADVMTFREVRGGRGIDGCRIAWLGDCNNVLYSWAQAAVMFGCELVVACPPAYRQALPGVVFCDDADDATAGADLVMTDTWVSMGDADAAERHAAFAPYAVTPARMARAKADAVFMHCLPAYRDKEVCAEVIDGAQSAVWQQAANRLHAQKALILFLLGITPD